MAIQLNHTAKEKKKRWNYFNYLSKPLLPCRGQTLIWFKSVHIRRYSTDVAAVWRSKGSWWQSIRLAKAWYIVQLYLQQISSSPPAPLATTFAKGVPQHGVVTQDLMWNAQDADTRHKPSWDAWMRFPCLLPTGILSPLSAALPHRPAAGSEGQQQLCWRQTPPGSHQWLRGGICGSSVCHQPRDCFTSEMGSWSPAQSRRGLVHTYFSRIVPFVIFWLCWVDGSMVLLCSLGFCSPLHQMHLWCLILFP